MSIKYQIPPGNSSGDDQPKKAKISLTLRYLPMPVEIDASDFQHLFNLGYRKGDIYFMSDKDREHILRHGIRMGEPMRKKGVAG